MNEAEILKRWREEKSVYQAWGEFVCSKICSELKGLVSPESLECFIKVPVVPRLKADSTLIDKALHRKKYANPYDDVTDKVGIRFVVLLTTDIKKVCEVVEEGERQGWWTSSKDRDFELERLEKPLEFSYQSVHYILRSKKDIEQLGITIPAGIPCEVQIRTLLQHAYSELTHDTLYKPKVVAQPDVKRTVAKSMALIETTDEFFEQAIDKLNKASSVQRQLLEFLAGEYERSVNRKPGGERSNEILIDAFSEYLPGAPYEELTEFFSGKSFIFDKIEERAGAFHFFSQPAVLLGYYLANKLPAVTQELWPLELNDLEIIYSDLGKSLYLH